MSGMEIEFRTQFDEIDLAYNMLYQLTGQTASPFFTLESNKLKG